MVTAYQTALTSKLDHLRGTATPGKSHITPSREAIIPRLFKSWQQLHKYLATVRKYGALELAAERFANYGRDAVRESLSAGQYAIQNGLQHHELFVDEARFARQVSRASAYWGLTQLARLHGGRMDRGEQAAVEWLLTRHLPRLYPHTPAPSEGEGESILAILKGRAFQAQLRQLEQGFPAAVSPDLSSPVPDLKGARHPVRVVAVPARGDEQRVHVPPVEVLAPTSSETRTREDDDAKRVPAHRVRESSDTRDRRVSDSRPPRDEWGDA